MLLFSFRDIFLNIKKTLIHSSNTLLGNKYYSIVKIIVYICKNECGLAILYSNTPPLLLINNYLSFIYNGVDYAGHWLSTVFNCSPTPPPTGHCGGQFLRNSDPNYIEWDPACLTRHLFLLSWPNWSKLKC